MEVEFELGPEVEQYLERKKHRREKGYFRQAYLQWTKGNMFVLYLEDNIINSLVMKYIGCKVGHVDCFVEN